MKRIGGQQSICTREWWSWESINPEGNRSQVPLASPSCKASLLDWSAGSYQGMVGALPLAASQTQPQPHELVSGTGYRKRRMLSANTKGVILIKQKQTPKTYSFLKKMCHNKKVEMCSLISTYTTTTALTRGEPQGDGGGSHISWQQWIIGNYNIVSYRPYLLEK